MRMVSYKSVVTSIAGLVAETCVVLPGDVLGRIVAMREEEPNPLAASILDQIIENARIAAEDRIPLCQDTGTAVFFADVGTGVCVDGDGLEHAIQEGTRRGYRDGGLRTSIVADPFTRVNTGDNTPAFVHLREVPGDSLTITFCPKGGGCENTSRLVMLTPGDGREGVVGFVLETVRIGGGRPCPPVIVGVGVGGTFEYAAILAKRSLMRTVGERSGDPVYAELERELLEKINALGIGPMGLGGRTTALEVFVESAPCHIASMPVAVNIQCHSARHGTIRL